MNKRIALLLILLLTISGLSASLADNTGWTCPECNSENTGNFCMVCGAPRPAEIVCPGCGTAFPADTPDRFCTECGTELQPEISVENGIGNLAEPISGSFATPEESAQRYIDGLRERDLDKMLSAFDWEALEAHMTLANTLERNHSYDIIYTTPGFPRDDSLLSAMNIQQMKYNTVQLINRSILRFLAEGKDGEKSLSTAAEQKYIPLEPDEVEGFIAQFDFDRLDSLARIKDVQFLTPEQVAGKPFPERAQKQFEAWRIQYGADELVDLCIQFTIDEKLYYVFPGFVRYGNIWTMYSLGSLSATYLSLNPYMLGFTSVDEM